MAEQGIFTLDSLAVRAEFGADVTFTVMCTRKLAVSQEAIEPLTWTSTVQTLSAHWYQTPPFTLSGIDMLPVVKVEIRNQTLQRYRAAVHNFRDGGLLAQPRIECHIYVTGASADLAHVELYGNDRAFANDGIVTFDPLAVKAPFGTTVFWQVACHGANDLAHLDGSIVVQNLTAVWQSEPRLVLNEKDWRYVHRHIRIN